MNLICNICNHRVLRHARQMACCVCNVKVHLKCLPGISQTDSIYVDRNYNKWFCLSCSGSMFPFNHLIDEWEYLSAILEQSITYRPLALSNLVFNPFDFNDIDASNVGSLQDSDPDLQYFNDATTIENVCHCDYYLEDTFKSKLKDMNLVHECFSLFHLNIRSIPKNLDNLEHYLKILKFKFSVIGITETWLNASNADLFCMSGYDHYCLYRTGKRGGGVSLFINENLIVKMRHDLDNMTEYIEAKFVEISKENSGLQKDAIIGIIYRPPNQDVSVFNEKLNEILSSIKNEKKLTYLMGDFNINILDTKNHIPSSEFLDIVYSHTMFPLITKPTRITSDTSTIIDNIFHNDITMNSLNGILYTNISDHMPVFSINYKTRLDSNVKPFKIRVMGEKNIKSFCCKLDEIDWSIVTESDNGPEAFTLFYKKYTDIYNECFPEKVVKSNYYNKKPWLTDAMKKSIKNKNRLYVKQLKTPTSENLREYKQYKTNLSRIMKSMERKHYQDLLYFNRNNTRKTWSIIKEVINKKSQSKSPVHFKFGDRLVSDKGIIASKFNHYFNNVGCELAKKIPHSDLNPLNYMGNFQDNSIYLAPADDSEVEKVILNLKNASPGCDSINAKIVKATYKKYLTPLTHILNLSISQGFFPDSMKIAKIVPLYKSGDPLLISNYRPVSVLPLFSKIFERIMYNRLMSFIKRHNILYKYQFGFREGHSTSMALTILIDHILSAIDKGEIVVGVFLDLKKAFDTVDHNILLSKIYKYGIRGTAHKWLGDYLNNRKQFVSFNYADSQKLEIRCGVPQGSILGPLLFLLYVNDIVNVSSSLMPIIFADDTNIFLKGRSAKDVTETINKELSQIVLWLNSNKLSLNVTKTHYMLFRGKGRKIGSLFPVKMCGSEIEHVTSTKFIGVMLDETIRWDQHVLFIKPKIGRGIGILCKAKKLLNKDTLISLYHCFIYPYLTYCIEVWGAAAQTYLLTLFNLQKKALRIVTSSKHRADSEPLFKQLRCLTLYQLYQKSIMVFMYKYVKGFLPSLFNSLFKRNSEISSRVTRNSNKLYTPLCRTETYRKTIIVEGPKMWNHIEDKLDTKCSIESFKRKLVKYLEQTGTISY